MLADKIVKNIKIVYNIIYMDSSLDQQTEGESPDAPIEQQQVLDQLRQERAEIKAMYESITHVWDLSSEQVEVILGKVQDIDRDGVAFSVFAADKFPQIQKYGLLGGDVDGRESKNITPKQCCRTFQHCGTGKREKGAKRFTAYTSFILAGASRESVFGL